MKRKQMKNQVEGKKEQIKQGQISVKVNLEHESQLNEFKLSRLEEQGVTLVALAVTIIIMLILAGVVLNIALGDNGLIGKTKQATEKYEEAQRNEEESIKDLEDNLKAQLKEAGEEVDVPHNADWDTSKVTPTSDGKGDVIPVPKGFYYAGGDKNSGFVISDVSGDDLNNSKQGNQFVWISCTADEYEKAKDDVMDKNWSSNNYYKDFGDDDWTGAEGGGSGEDWSDDYDEEDNQFISEVYKKESIESPTDTWEKSQTTVATTSLSKYKGFYIARFEAGVPSDAEFYVTTEKLEYIQDKGSIKNTEKIRNLSPVSKKGAQVWNFIAQVNTKVVAENMYKNGNNDTSKSVGSYLVDNGAWNVICNIYDKILGTNDKEKTINSSTKLGNYYNNSFTNYSKINCLWALHGDVGSSQLENATTYTIGQVTVKPDEKYKNNDNTGKNRIELATGVCDDFKIYNIYDMAGNMFEYTTGHNIKIINNKNRIRTVSRGGGFKYAGDTYPIAFANGSGAISAGDVVCGFRVVLYIK